MAKHPFLKSIQPVNLLSFGPKTEPIELRPLNILIGPNGSGKSNLIEIIGLLSKLPDKDPWSRIIQTGGAQEWTWKGKNAEGIQPSLTVITSKSEQAAVGANEQATLGGTEQTQLGMLYRLLHADKSSLFYSISLSQENGRFSVENENFQELNDGRNADATDAEPFDRVGRRPRGLGSTLRWSKQQLSGQAEDQNPGRSVLSMLGNEPTIAERWPRMVELANEIERFAFYRDWVFGSRSEVRDVQPVGFDSYRLAEGSINLAQVLKAMRDRGDASVFERLLGLLRKFYEPVKDVDTELVGTHLRIMIKEEGLSSRTPAERLSDGTLRWLMLLIILLDPTPPPVICIEEPELGLHPDAIHTLADLLIDASTRTQLIVTTHSDALLDAFTDTPEDVCVCEKVEGATRIQRLDKQRLKAWLDDYSLGQLWAKGEIGGNRW